MIDIRLDLRSVDMLRAVGPKSKPVKDGKFRSFSHAAATIRKHAIESIKPSKAGRRLVRETKVRPGRKSRRYVRYRPSPPGTPPFTHRGKGFVRQGILFAADQSGAVIGPTYSKYGEAMSAHEFGGQFRGQTYPERPFMQPALQANLDRFAASFAGQIGT